MPVTQFVPISELEAITGYTSRKSIRKWLAREFGLPLLRIGRQYCVVRAQFEKAVSRKYKVELAKAGYRPKQQAEKDFLDDLTRSFTELPCASNEKET